MPNVCKLHGKKFQFFRLLINSKTNVWHLRCLFFFISFFYKRSASPMPVPTPRGLYKCQAYRRILVISDMVIPVLPLIRMTHVLVDADANMGTNIVRIKSVFIRINPFNLW